MSGRKKSSSTQASMCTGDTDHPVDVVTCPECKETVSDGDDSLQCEICENWYHIGCQNVNKTTYKVMEKHPNNIHWYCNICEKGAGKLVLAINKLSRRQDDLEQTVCKNTERLDAAEGKLGEHGDKIAEIENSLRAHTDLIAQAQADAQRDGSASTVATGTNQEQVIMSEVTKTVNERLERQKNIIVFNAPEANSNLRDEVMKADMTYVKELCRYLCGEDLHYSVKRLGKRVKKNSNAEADHQSRSGDRSTGRNGGGSDDSGQNHENGEAESESSRQETWEPRPLLVQFNELEGKGKIMKKLFRLGEEEVPDDFADISVKHDMTPSERETEKALRKQAREKTTEQREKNVKFVVRGPPWERMIVKMIVHGKRLVPADEPEPTVPSKV